MASSTTFALPGGATCADFDVLLEQPFLDGRDDAVKVPDPVRAAAYLRIAGSAPEELSGGWQEIMRVQRKEPGSNAAVARDALDQSLSWATRTCPQSRPVWFCTARVRTDPPVASPGQPEPDDVLSADERAITPIVLDETDSALLYGFGSDQRLGPEQLIVRTVEALRGPGGWNRGVAFACPGAPAGASPVSG